MAKIQDISGHLVKLDGARLVFVAQSAEHPGGQFIAFRNEGGDDTKSVLSAEAANALASLLKRPIGGADKWPQGGGTGWRLVTDAEPERMMRAQKAPEPFKSATEAWMWCMAALTARRDGQPRTASGRRPCEPDDIVRVVDTLYRRRQIDLPHARVLRVWGERQTAPNPTHAAKRCDWQLWTEAIDRLDWPLRAKGIVA